MRLWTIHPRYLDARGLVAAWREALLAQKVLLGRTRGYTRHPQLERFSAQPRPVAAMGAFLTALAEEATLRAYHFDLSKISHVQGYGLIEETRGQLLYEWEHLRSKLRVRAPEVYHQIQAVEFPEAHPLFRIVPGDVREWERR